MDNTVKGAIIAGVFSVIVAIIGGFTGVIPGLFEVDQPPVISDLIPTPSGPQVDGTPITWNAIANDPNKDTISYRFELNSLSTGKRYVVKQDWSEKSDWIWNSTDSDIGINYIRVSVKDEKHNEPSGNATIIENYCIADRMMNQGEIGYSNIKKMILDKTYTFSAYVARNDSIDGARRRITTGVDSGEWSVPVLNNTLINTDFWTGSKVFVSKVTIMHPEIEADLRGDAFEISRLTPAIQTIPVDRRGKNYGLWLWNVRPTKPGTQFLELTPYEVPTKTSIGGGSIRIEVTVEENIIAIPPAPVVEAAPAAAAVAEEKVTEAATKAAEKAEKATPGFESIFAITGLLAVAFLILGRRE